MSRNTLHFQKPNKKHHNLVATNQAYSQKKGHPLHNLHVLETSLITKED
jgi:hypothetical protein